MSQSICIKLIGVILFTLGCGVILPSSRSPPVFSLPVALALPLNKSAAGFDEKKRLSVSMLVEATLRAANADSMEEIFTPEEIQALMDSTKTEIVTSSKGQNNKGSWTAPPVCQLSSCKKEDHKQEQNKSDTSSPPQKQQQHHSDDDRRARLIADAPNDFDCMEREFDATDPGFDPKLAAEVYDKCRIIVVRNMYTSQQMARFRKITEDFVVGLHEHRVDKESPMINGNEKFFSQRSEGKWEILHPEYFLEYASDFVSTPILKKIIFDPHVLGPQAVFGGSGVLLAQPGTDGGHWHADANFLFGEDSLQTLGIAGHDIPSFAVNIATPIVNLTVDSGLTEYCIGTTHLSGTGGMKRLNLSNEELINNTYFSTLWKARDFTCPPDNWRVPDVGPGDLVLWDYLIRHRSGGNSSPNLRPLLFATYAREWYQDANFQASGMGKGIAEEERFLAPRQMANVTNPYKQCKNDTLCDISLPGSPAITSIKEMFHPQFDFGKIHGHVGRHNGREIMFSVANKDVPGAAFLIGTDYYANVKPGAFGFLRAQVGSDLQLAVGDDILKSWTVRSNQQQIIISRQSLQMDAQKNVHENTTKLENVV